MTPEAERARLIADYGPVYPENPSCIRGPGKFEGEALWVPYYREKGLEGFADRDDGQVWGFDVTPEDKRIFPELKRRRTVKLLETNSGFVCEVR